MASFKTIFVLILLVRAATPFGCANFDIRAVIRDYVQDNPNAFKVVHRSPLLIGHFSRNVKFFIMIQLVETTCPYTIFNSDKCKRKSDGMTLRCKLVVLGRYKCKTCCAFLDHYCEIKKPRELFS